MDRINLVVLQEDRQHTEMLVQFIRTTDYAGQVIVRAFSDRHIIETFMDQDSGADIVLAEPAMLQSGSQLENTGSIILLVEHLNTNDDSVYPTVFKYQPFNQLLSKVLGIYSEHNTGSAIKLRASGKSSVISIFSAAGGYGKTTVAVNLAKQLALQDCQVFYLNLEYISASTIFFRSDGNQDFSQILYYLKTRPEQVASKLQQLVKVDPETKIQFLEPAKDLKEISEITRKDIHLLIQSLCRMGNFDYIVIDLDSMLDERIIGALLNSHRILWLLSDDFQCMHKTRHLLDVREDIFYQIDPHFHKKINFVLNKYTGISANDFPGCGITVQGYLPYIPEWKSVTDSGQLLGCHKFNEHLIKLYTSLCRPNEAVDAIGG